MTNSRSAAGLGRRMGLAWLLCVGLSGSAGLLGGCAKRPPVEESKRLFDTTRHDLGAIRLESEYTANYRITNSTAEPVAVRSIQTSCGCMAADYDPSVIPVGGHRIITLTLSTKGVSTLGPLVKHAWVEFASQPKVELELLARLEPEFELQPRTLSFSADQPEQKLRLFRRQLERTSFAALELVASPDYYEVQEDVSLGIDDQRDFVIRLKDSPASAVLPALAVADASHKVLPFSTVLCSRSGPTLRPSAFVVVVTDINARPPTQRFELVAPDSRPLRILEVQSEGEQSAELLEVTFTPGRDAQSFGVALRRVPTEPHSKLQVAVTFESDEGVQGRIVLPCHVVVAQSRQP